MEYDEKALLARVTAGFRGGDWFKSPVQLPARQITNGWPAETMQKMNGATFPQPTPSDVWNSRRSK